MLRGSLSADNGAMRVVSSGAGCDCKCGEQKGALVYCPAKSGKLGCVAATDLPSDLAKLRHACQCPLHPEALT